MKKRLLSILLTLCMVLTLLPVTALAAETYDYKPLTLTDDEGTVYTYSDAALGYKARIPNGDYSLGDNLNDYEMIEAPLVILKDNSTLTVQPGPEWSPNSWTTPNGWGRCWAVEGKYEWSYMQDEPIFDGSVNYTFEFMGDRELVNKPDGIIVYNFYLESGESSGYFCLESQLSKLDVVRAGDQPEVAEPEQPSTSSTPSVNAVLSPQKLEADGKNIDCEKYNIGGSNYFKLRDLAQLLSGTGSRFGVDYDEASATVIINTGEAYESTGTELVTGVDNSATAQPSSQAILIDGVKHDELTVYNIGGSNFFQLRELGSILGFDVGYDEATNTATVQSARK